MLRANAFRPPPAPGTPAEPAEFSLAVVTVNGADVTDVHLAPVAPATVSGRVFFDDPGAAVALKPSALRVVWQALNPDDMGIGIASGSTPPTSRSS
jgi:hypothetical protein